MELRMRRGPESPTYEMLLMDYAAGALDDALNLLMATHLTLNPAARRMMMQMEAIGGAIMEQACAPVPMSAGCLEKMMNMLSDECERPRACAEARTRCPDAGRLPQDLRRNATGKGHIVWKRAASGLEVYTFSCSKSPMRTRLMKMAPGFAAPLHRRSDYEFTLVLDGAFTDESGRHIKGDLVIIEERRPQRAVADEVAGCLCLGVTPAPSFRGNPFEWLAGLLRR